MKIRRSIACCLVFAIKIGVLASVQERLEQAVIQEKIRRAHSLQDKGSLQQAKTIFESLLPTLKSKPPSSQLGLVLNDLSQIALAEGNYDTAVKNARQAAEVYRTARDQEGEAHAFNNKGIAEINHGDYAFAQSDLEQALRLSRAAGDKENEIQILNNLGSAFYFRGMYSEALTNYDIAMNEVRGSAAQPWSVYWNQITNFNEATLYQRLGRYGRALDIYKQVESSSRTLDVSDRAHMFANLGTLYRRLGDPWKALASYRQATELYKMQKDADGELSVLKDLGIVYALDLGDLPKAEQIFRRALWLAQNAHNQRQQMQVHLYLGETLLRKNAPKAAQPELGLALDSAKQMGTREEEWKALYGLGRAEEIAANLPSAESDYREAISIIESARALLQFPSLRAEFLADKRDVYDALIKLLLQRNDVPAAFSFLERSRTRTFQDRLQLNQSGTGNPVAAIDELRNRLDDSSIVLDFWTADNRLAVIWFTRRGYGSSQKQLSASELDQTGSFLQNLPGTLNDSQHGGSAILSHILYEGFASLPASIKHLVIVPDGWLSSVPFDLLHAPADSKPLLIEKYSISYLPTALLLERTRLRTARFYFPWTRELVAFGDPVIHTPGSLEDEPGANWLQLPRSAEEIRTIAAMINGRKEIFVGPADSKHVFLTGKANDGFLLHISTHAMTDANNPENSRLLFSSENNLSADYVFLRELSELNLSGVNLATISACDTERGKLVRGEGVQAFSRALIGAGSRSSLTTLWRVEDEATAEFMKQFYYFALERHLPRAEALRRAKLKFLHSQSALRDPQYWAAFVLNGDGIQPLPRVLSWPELACVTVGLVVLLSVAAVLWRRSGRDRKYDARGAVSQ
jgi:CHAT domain-containing protein/tetratricopeptide (TPR) repeat protein